MPSPYRGAADPGQSLAHVAIDVGFADQSHRTRRFKAAYGMPPGRGQRLTAKTAARSLCAKACQEALDLTDNQVERDFPEVRRRSGGAESA